MPLRIEQIPEAAWALERGMSVVSDLAVCRRLFQPSCPDYKTGIPPSTAYQVVSGLAHVPAVVVMSIGYNDPPPQFAAGAAAVMRKLTSRGVKHVIWVTLRDTHTDSAAVNRVIFGLQRRWPGVVSVLDWNASSRGQPWFDDEIHLNTAGALAMARMIRARVLAACGKTCLLPARPPLQPLPPRERICVERAGDGWAAVLATATSARDALALHRRAVAEGFTQNVIVQATPTVWEIVLFGFPTRASVVHSYTEFTSHGFRATIVANVDKCGDENGDWRAIAGRTPSKPAAHALLDRVRSSGYRAGSRVEQDDVDNYAVIMGVISSSEHLPAFAAQALRNGYIVSFAPN